MTNPYSSGDFFDRLASCPFMLAPMAGVTDAAYRIMCRRRGAKTAFSEMVSVAGLSYASEHTWELVLPADEEPQICVQLFGSKPEQFAFAVDAVQQRVGDKLTSIDINMACPARKVVTKGEGSALMLDLVRAQEIARHVVRAAEVPVSVKMRRGYTAGELTAPELAKRLEDVGVAYVTVHGRSATQLYTGMADWSVIDAVADAVSIPVVGSGDVMSAQDAVRMLSTTKASGVLIARGTYGAPWIFADALRCLYGEPSEVHDASERLNALREHLDLLHQLHGHMAKARTFATWYLKGLPHAARWRGRVVQCSTYEEFSALLDAIELELASCDSVDDC